MQVLENCEGAWRCGLLAALSAQAHGSRGHWGSGLIPAVAQPPAALACLGRAAATQPDTCEGLALVQSKSYRENAAEPTSAAQIWLSVVPTIVVIPNDIKSSWLFKQSKK